MLRDCKKEKQEDEIVKELPVDKPVYPHSFAYARDHGELDDYHESNQLNSDCAAAIDRQIAASSYEQYHYDLPGALAAVRKKFSLERVEWVAAATVRHFDHDGRYSRANKEWAENFPVPENYGGYFLLNSHACLADGFAKTVREARVHELAQAVGKDENSRRIVQRNRLTRFDDETNAFVPQKGATQNQLAERYAKVQEKAAARRAAKEAKPSVAAALKRETGQPEPTEERRNPLGKPGIDQR